MSHCSSYPLAVNSYGILACSLPDDGVALMVETDLLQRWGYPADFIRAEKRSFEGDENQEDKPQPADIKLGADVRLESNDTRLNEDTATRPNEATATRPNEATATRPNEATATRPNEATANRPNEATATRPNEDTATRPNEDTATRPNEDTATRPNEDTATRPNEATATRPNEATQSYLSGAGTELSARVRELYEQAEACYRSGQSRDSLTYIDEALSADDVHVNHVLLTLKVKVLNSMGNYAESLRSAAKVNAGSRSKELLLEGATALDNLDLLFAAEEWLKAVVLDRSDEPEGLPCTQKAVQLFHSVRNKRIYRPLIKQAPVNVAVSHRGRAVYAKKAIPRGEIFSELPEFLEQGLASRVTACAHCGRSLAKPEDVLIKGKPLTTELKKVLKKLWLKRASTSCQVCSRVLYCSELCRDEAWFSYHKVLCPSSVNAASAVLYDVRDSFLEVPAGNGFSWQGWWNAEFSPLLMARVWAAMLVQAKLRAGDKVAPAMADWLTVFSQLEKYSSACETQVCSSVPKTFELMRNIFKRSKILHYEITEAEFNKKYNKISMNYISFHDVSDTVQPFLDKVKKDAKLYKKIGTFFKDPLPKTEFHGLFPVASCLNHSCMPNAEIRSGVVDGRPGIVVAALRDIGPLEEIMISYVSPELRRKERRDMLMRRYRFWCQCPKCLFEGDGPDRCTECGKWALCTPGSKTGQSDKEEMAYVQTVVDVNDKSCMQTFSTRFESPQSTEVFVEPSSSNSASGRDDQGDTQESANPELIEPKPENAHGINECCHGCDHSNQFVESDTSNQGHPSKMSREGPGKASAQATEASPTAYNEIQDASVRHIENDISLRGSEPNKEIGRKFPHCARCGRAWYCSQHCQKEAWKRGHKKICGKF